MRGLLAAPLVAGMGLGAFGAGVPAADAATRAAGPATMRAAGPAVTQAAGPAATRAAEPAARTAPMAPPAPGAEPATAPDAGDRARCHVLVYKQNAVTRVRCDSHAKEAWYQRHYCKRVGGQRYCATPAVWRDCRSRNEYWRCPLGEPRRPATPLRAVPAGAGGMAGMPRADVAAAGMALIALGGGLGLVAARRRRAGRN